MDKDIAWDYSAKNGQHTWGKHWTIGNHQSPINIATSCVKYDVLLQQNPIQFTSTSLKFQAVNKGINVSVTPSSIGENSMRNGPLADRYDFIECHFHWGRNFQRGSEHEIDDTKTEAELHLVHKKTTAEKPTAQKDGLSVLGIRLIAEENIETHPTLKSILQMLNEVTHKSQEIVSKDSIDIYKLLDNISEKYYTYDGSLTTPPLAEAVKWIVFKEPLAISKSDYSVFNKLHPVAADDVSAAFHDPYSRTGPLDTQSKPIIGDNFRDVCPLNDRIIRSSFE